MNATRTMAAAVLVGWLTSSVPALGADSAAGQKTFAATCAACHKAEMKHLTGKSESQLETEIKAVIAGTAKHPKKLTLSDDEIANVATYIASNPPAPK